PADEADEVRGIAVQRVLPLLAHHDREGDLGEVVHADVVDRAAAEQLDRSVDAVSPEALAVGDPHGFHEPGKVSTRLRSLAARGVAIPASSIRASRVCPGAEARYERPCRSNQYSRNERSRGRDSRSFARPLASLLAMMSSGWHTEKPSISTRRFQASANRSMPSGAKTRSRSKGPFLSCTKSLPRSISAAWTESTSKPSSRRAATIA